MASTAATADLSCHLRRHLELPDGTTITASCTGTPHRNEYYEQRYIGLLSTSVPIHFSHWRPPLVSAAAAVTAITVDTMHTAAVTARAETR